MIKNAFLQRISEKPLNVPPFVDWNRMDVKKYNQKSKRRQKKPNLQQILNILHLHPCYFLNLYKLLEDGLLTKEDLLKFLKNIYPSVSFTN